MSDALDPTPARRLRDAIEPIAMVHVHSEEARQQYEAIGLDRFAGYVLGRAGVLGLPPSSLVVATFGVFAPETLAATYESALTSASVPDVLAAKQAGATRCLHRVLGDPGREVEEAVAVLRAGIDRAEPLGKPLFAGHLALDWPGDAWGRLWHATNLLRELRGDAHIAALVASSIGPLEANLLTEARVGLELETDGRRSLRSRSGQYTRTRGWTGAQIEEAVADLVDRLVLTTHGGLTERGRDLRDDIEDATETALDPVLEGMEHAFDTVVGRCEEWSGAIVRCGAFPDDPHKRAAG